MAPIVLDFQQKQQQKAGRRETGYRAEEQGAGKLGLQKNIKKQHFTQPQIRFDFSSEEQPEKEEEASKRNDGADK